MARCCSSPFLLLLLLAFVVRAGLALAVNHHVQSVGRTFLIEGDANGYWELGRRIANGDEYSIYTPPRRVLRMPGFPLLLAGCIKLLGDDVFRATLVMAFTGTLCCALTGALTAQILDSSAAKYAMLISAVSPLQAGSNVMILSETWFSFWMLLCLLAGYPLLNKRNSKFSGPESLWRERMLSLVVGACTGITVLVRPGWILWVGCFSMILLCFGKGDLRRRVTLCLIVTVACYGVLTPWAWRNARITGHWIFTSLWSGPSLYDGLHPKATGASDMTFVDTENLYATMSEFEVNETYKKRAAKFAIENPIRTLELAWIKAGRYLSLTPNAEGFQSPLFSLISLSWYALFFGLTILGLVCLRGCPATVALLTAPFLLFLLVHMVFVGSIRYRLPVEFPLATLAAHGWITMQRSWSSNSSS